MKKHSMKSGWIPLTCALLMGAITIASAQPAPRQPRQRPLPADSDNEPARPRGERPQRQDRQQIGTPQGGVPGLMRVLTEEQARSFRQAMREQGQEVRKVAESLAEARKALLKASLTGEYKAAAVQKQARQIGKLETEMLILRAEAMSQIAPPLSAEQVEQLLNSPRPELDRARRAPEDRIAPQDRPRRYAPEDRPPRRPRPDFDRGDQDRPPGPPPE